MSNIATDIVNQFKKGHTSVSFLLSGPKGTGKKKIVEQVAEELLGKNSATLMSGLKWVECGLTEEAKKTFQKAIQSDFICEECSKHFNKVKELTDELGYASNMKEYKKNPEAYKGNVADISTVIRVAITGKSQTPDLYEILKLLGTDRIKERINRI